MFRAQSCRPGIRPAGRQADDFPCGSAAFLQQRIKKLSQKRMEELSQKRIEKLLQKSMEELSQRRMDRPCAAGYTAGRLILNCVEILFNCSGEWKSF